MGVGCNILIRKDGLHLVSREQIMGLAHASSELTHRTEVIPSSNVKVQEEVSIDSQADNESYISTVPSTSRDA